MKFNLSAIGEQLEGVYKNFKTGSQINKEKSSKPPQILTFISNRELAILVALLVLMFIYSLRFRR